MRRRFGMTMREYRAAARGKMERRGPVGPRRSFRDRAGRSVELHAPATRTVADARALRFLARLDAGLLEIALVADGLEEIGRAHV